MIGTTNSWFLFAQTQPKSGGLSLAGYMVVIFVITVIVRQVRKSLTPKDKRGIENFGGPAKGERHE